MRKFSILLLFFLLLISSLSAITPVKPDIIEYCKNFLDQMINKKAKTVQNMICPEVKLLPLEKTKIMQLCDDMMMEKISISKYILMITGHNLHQFLNHKLRLINFKLINEYGVETKYDNKTIKEKLYYIRFKASYEKEGKIHNDKIIEINIIKEDNKYKVIGFII
ncbi:MAG: hypothetical protein KKH98_08350 [Spirochaetes bacterium]|nr:hypothetical protein [Spirochaetota bacterium]